MFVIFSSARTGSNYLIDRLNSTRLVVCHYEVFHPDGMYFSEGIDQRFWRKGFGERDRNPGEFLESLMEQTKITFRDCISVGFKIFPEHAPEAFRFLDSSRSFNHFLLYRENKLAQYSSLLIAQKTDEWYATNERNESKQFLVTFNEEDFEKYCKNIIGYEDHITRSYSGSLTILEYREVVVPTGALKILSVIVPDHAPSTLTEGGLKKQNSHHILDRFTNPDEALRYLCAIGRTSWQFEF